MMEKCQLAVIGGGPAGIAAAVAAYEQGVRDIWLIERDRDLGGILNQCIHNGFGLHYFKEELTGPEYAARFIAMLKETTVRVISDTMVLDISGDRVIHFVNTEGYHTAQADSIILAMGCRERTRGAISIPGTIAMESTLSYLGLGLGIETPSLGILLRNARVDFLNRPYLLFFPAVIVSIVTFTFYIVGNAFSDAADPKNHV